MTTWDNISACGLYRYELGERWSDGKLVVFVLCNPSTATKDQSDATSRKTVGFAKHWGFGGRIIVNVCALRAGNPRSLLAYSDPIGPDNLAVINNVLANTSVGPPVVVGWGNALPARFEEEAQRVAQLLQRKGAVKCLGRTKSGAPRHPLMLPYSTPLQPYL